MKRENCPLLPGNSFGTELPFTHGEPVSWGTGVGSEPRRGQGSTSMVLTVAHLTFQRAKAKRPDCEVLFCPKRSPLLSNPASPLSNPPAAILYKSDLNKSILIPA